MDENPCEASPNESSQNEIGLDQLPLFFLQQLAVMDSDGMPLSGTYISHDDVPHQPVHYVYPKKKMGSQMRSFQAHWFKEFPWLHYNEQNDCVLCFVCAQQNAKSNLRSLRHKEAVFTGTGYSNWKKARCRFKEHQESECHKLAFEFQIIPETHGNILELTSNAAMQQMEKNRRCLIKIIESLQFLARQGLAIQGKTDGESNFIQLLKVRAKDEPVLLEWLDKTNKYISHDIQKSLILWPRKSSKN